MIDVQQALIRAAGQLAAHPDLRPTAVPDATILLMHSLGIDRAALIAHPERPLTREQLADIQRLVERRLRFEPIQYILGTQEFYGLRFKVTPAVLIPRPETETLVEAVLSQLRVPHPRDGGIGPRPTVVRIADIGTGSGAIAVALAHALPQAQITALDLSPQALAIASENAQINGVADRIRFLESDLLAAIADEPPFDAIVSNPPYIPTSDAPTLHQQVREFEPSQALFAGPDGLDIYTRLIPQAFAAIKPNGLLAMEIGFGQCDAIATLLANWNEVAFLPDLQQIPRVAIARRTK
jgi:release factor glutamine methyltransferase